MGLIQRFLLGNRVDDDLQVGLFLKNDGTVWLRNPERSETQVTGSGGSSQVAIADLGILDVAAIFSGGPATLNALDAGQFLAAVKFTDTDFVATDLVAPLIAGSFRINLAIGTVKSFGWWGFALFSYNPPESGAQTWTDTVGAYGGGYVYGPNLGVVGGDAMVLSAADGGPIQAGFIANLNEAADGAGITLDAIIAWAAATVYGTPVTNTPATSGVKVKAAVVANGTIWLNVGAPGTSGGSPPDFAGNAGGTVVDNQTAFAITAVDQGAGTITIAGDHRALFPAGSPFSVSGSTDNDGDYVVASVSFGSGNTVIDTGAPLNDGTADGDVLVGIVWQDSTTPPPTVGQVHPVAEIWTPS